MAGHIRLSALTTKLQGTAEITYPGTASIDYPSVDSFLAGQNLNLGGDWVLGAGATINASQTGGNIQLDGDFRVAGRLDVTGYFPFSSSSANVYNVDGSDQVTLFALTAFEGTPEVPPLPILGFGGSLGPYRVNPDDVTVNPDGVITATGTDNFSNFTFDLDAIAASLLYGIGAPTLGVNVNLQDLGIPLDLVLGYDIFDADAHIDFTASQTLTFNPSTSIKLSFDPPPAGITGPYASQALDNSWVIFATDAQVGIEFPPGRRDPIDVTPQVLLDSTLHNQSSLATNSFIQLKAGRFDYQIPSFGIFPAFGPFDTGLDFPETHGDFRWHHTHTDDETHDLVVEGILICEDCVPHSHTSTHHHSSFCVCFGHFHNAVTHFHDINIGPFGPSGFPGLDVSQSPVWGPENYFENPGPPFSLADETLDLPFTPISLSSFQLEPNDPPLPDPGGPYTVDEGSSVGLAALATDEEGDPITTLAWDLDDNGSFETPGGQVTFLGVDGLSVHMVTVQACDPYSCAEASTTVTVYNVAPVITGVTGPVDPVSKNVLTDPVVVSFTDVGILDTHSCTYSWDSSDPDTVVAASGGTCSVGHTYSAAGVYTIGITVADDDSGSAATTFEFIVVYDTDAGFVTGGGWIDSPEGACTLGDCAYDTTGRATFGFVAKYLPGLNTPDGNTEFQFKVGNLNFHSGDYVVLVVSGWKAQYRGNGTINGTGNYQFILTPYDGDRPGGYGVDRFRIKIKDEQNQVVYDNRRGLSDDMDTADPQVISQGSIVIHTKNK